MEVAGDPVPQGEGARRLDAIAGPPAPPLVQLLSSDVATAERRLVAFNEQANNQLFGGNGSTKGCS